MLTAIISAGFAQQALCDAPLYRIQMLLQTQSQLIPNPKYTSTLNCISRIYSEQGGFSAFYRGAGPTFLLLPVIPTINALVKHPCQRLTGDHLGAFLSGVVAGKVKTFFMYPSIVMQVLMRCDTTPNHVRKYGTYREMLNQLKTSPEGYWALYRGYPTACAAIWIYRGFQTGIYELVNEYQPKNLENNAKIKIAMYEDKQKEQGFLCPDDTKDYQDWLEILKIQHDQQPKITLAIASGSTLIAQILSYPLATVGNCVRAQAGQHKKLNNGPIDAMFKLVKAEKHLYKGFAPYFLRTYLPGVATLLLGDIMYKKLHENGL